MLLVHGCVSRWKITVFSFGNFRKHWSTNQDKVDTRQQFELKRNSLPTPDAGILAMPDDFNENVKHRGICFGAITQKHRGSRSLLLAWKTTCFRPRKIREAINIHTRPWSGLPWPPIYRTIFRSMWRNPRQSWILDSKPWIPDYRYQIKVFLDSEFHP